MSEKPLWLVYSKPNCVYCNRAKSFLSAHGVDYAEVDVLSLSHEELQDFRVKYRSVPQIFYGETYVGTFEDLETYWSSTFGAA